jgi:glycosyltransferase involved in cell wall biosynthesis
MYFSAEVAGGLADYAHQQASALSRLGVRVSLLAAPLVAESRAAVDYSLQPVLANPPDNSQTSARLVRWVRSARWVLNNVRSLANQVRMCNARHVLMGSYFEYLAPLWASALRRLARNGVVFGAVVHDPVRQTFVGPQWWQRSSVSAAYSFLREAFVHEAIELETVKPFPRLRTTVIPHGPYRFNPPSLTKTEVRQTLGIPSNGLLMLSFGYIRDEKNLHLLLRSMRENPKCYLLVAGKELGSTQRSAAYYQHLADELGVANRCRWKLGFVPPEDVGNWFQASDLVLLTYSGRFRSASGVLNAAIQYRKPCLASAGKSNLRSAVERYRLGAWVEPDNAEALTRALASLDTASMAPDWAGYERDNSWKKNAELVLKAMME